MRKITMFALVFMFLSITGSFAQTRYVAFAGDNTNDGLTVGTAYKTVEHALLDTPTTIIVDGTVDGSTWKNNFLNGYTADITIQGQNNAAVNYGGRAFRIEGAINVTLNDIAFTFTGGTFGDEGGFIFTGSQSGNLTINNCTVQNYTNTPFTGGTPRTAAAIRNNGTGTITISNSSFINNNAGVNGGAIWKNNGDLTITNSRFRNNTADLDGGAIFAAGGVDVTITDSSFDGNKASNEDADITDETAAEGGAIYITGGGFLKLNTATFFNNRAEYQGSAVWDNSSNANHEITNCTFIENEGNGISANSDRAAAYRTENGTYAVTNSIFFGNTVDGKANGDISFVGGTTTGTIANSLVGNPQGNNLTSGINVNLDADNLSTTTFTFNATTGKVEFSGPSSITDATPVDYIGTAGSKTDAGAWQSSINLFNGSNASWSNTGSWTSGTIPSATENITIPNGLTNNALIGATDQITINNLFVNSGSELTIASGGSFIVNGGSVQGTVNAQRTIEEKVGNDEGWFLMSSPFSNEVVDTDFFNDNNIADNATVKGIGYYNTSANNWTYIPLADNDDILSAGKGFSLKRSTSGGAAPGTITFKGSLNINDSGVDITMSTDTDGFNLIGNPYTSHINLQTIINVANSRNAANLDLNQIWLWNQDTKNYDVKTVGDASFDIAPTQAFFVKASAAVNFEFEESDQIHSAGNTFQKSSQTGFKIMVSNGELDRYAKVYFNDNVTKGFDNGFDGETFTGIKNSFDIYTRLVSNNIGKNYQIQALPKGDMKSFEIPLGLTSEEGKEITFTTDLENLPQGNDVYLEDRLLGKITKLTSDTSYKVVLDSKVDGIGRFYIKASSKALSIEDNLSTEISMYQSSKNELTLSGLLQGQSNISVYNILGKQVLYKSFNSNGVKQITLPNLNTGVYLVSIQNSDKTLNKKIVLK